MKSKLKGLLLGSLIADALALGPHWIYDIKELDKKFPKFDSISAPHKTSYHKNREKGDFTHYGDQTYLLYKFIVENKGYDNEKFKRHWMKYMNTYDGYLDHASKSSLTLLSNNNSNGSDSSDLAGAARIAPLIVHYYQEKEILYQYVKEETQLTHNNDLVVEIADFIGHVVIDVLSGYQPIEAIKELKKQYSTDLIKLIDQGLDNLDKSPRALIQLTGQSCNLNDALPATVYFIAKYENDFKDALIANTLAGGDSAARGLVIGMVLGAYLGIKSIPEQWILDTKVSSDIKS